MDRFEIVEYIAAGCFQVERGPGFVVGIGLHGYTDGRMCDGCPQFREGRCPSYKELTRGRAQKKRELIAPTETVREEAARIGISISEVRRRRSGGEVTPNAIVTGAPTDAGSE